MLAWGPPAAFPAALIAATASALVASVEPPASHLPPTTICSVRTAPRPASPSGPGTCSTGADQAPGSESSDDSGAVIWYWRQMSIVAPILKYSVTVPSCTKSSGFQCATFSPPGPRTSATVKGVHHVPSASRTASLMTTSGFFSLVPVHSDGRAVSQQSPSADSLAP